MGWTNGYDPEQNTANKNAAIAGLKDLESGGDLSLQADFIDKNIGALSSENYSPPNPGSAQATEYGRRKVDERIAANTSFYSNHSANLRRQFNDPKLRAGDKKNLSAKSNSVARELVSGSGSRRRALGTSKTNAAESLGY